MMAVTFDLGAVLSVTTSVLLCPLDELYEILNFMTGDNLFTHQLPRASRVCGQQILQQHPGLEIVDASGVTRENWETFLSEQKHLFGDAVPLVPLTDWEYKDPVDEATEMVGEEKVTIWIGVRRESNDGTNL
jgi:hypothetical protein